MHLTTTLAALFLSLHSATATPTPQGTTHYYIKLITVYGIDSSVSGPNSQDIPSSSYYGFQDEIDKCWYYGYERFAYGHIEVESGLSCNFYSQKECAGSHFTVVGAQKTARGGSKQPVFLSFKCEYGDKRGGRGGGDGRGGGRGGRGRL